MISTTEQLAKTIGVSAACQALTTARSSLYRKRPKVVSHPKPERLPSPRALPRAEKEIVRQELNSERFADQAPREVFATLMDEGTYLCSWRTMYRILDENQEVRERRNQLRHPNYTKPELLATRIYSQCCRLYSTDGRLCPSGAKVPTAGSASHT